MVNSVSGNCIEKAKALNIPLAGYRLADNGKFDLGGVIACLWSASPVGDDDALYVYLLRGNDAANDYWDDRGHGFPVRSFLDKKRA